MDNSTGVYNAWTNAVTLPSCPPVGIEGEQTIPKEFSLKQNYPNPFNPSTRIEFSLAEFPLNKGGERGLSVTLLIYDILGNLVETLLDEPKQPGKYVIDFNAAHLPSGVYFYKMKAGGFVGTKKMLLIK
jgi:hypothetical protein